MKRPSLLATTLLLIACSVPPLGTTTGVRHDTSSSPASRSSQSEARPASSRSPAAPSHLLPVPFSTQAPLVQWDALHQEACEEAALILVHHFLEGTTITPEQMESEIQTMVAWETANGYGEDVTTVQLGEIAHAVYGYNVRTIDNPTADDLRRLLADGHPIIAPMAGRELGNPYFTGDGPWYHMIVLRGYRRGWTGNLFITNDVGTRRGEAYEYAETVIMNALHDWTGVKEETRTGPKRVLVVEK